MQKIFVKVFLALAAVSLSYAANRPVPIQEGRWQLIGISGYHQAQQVDPGQAGGANMNGACEEVACMDMGEKDIALISIKGSVLPTFDANSTYGNLDYSGVKADPNGYSPTVTQKIFTSKAVKDGNIVMWIENNGTTTGSSLHSVLGIHTLNHGDTRLTRAAIAIDYDPNKIVKGTSPIKTMFIRSPSANDSFSQPDIKLFYQSTLEGKPFKLMLSEGNDFKKGDVILTGKFNERNTWDKPAYYDKDNPDKGGLTVVPDPGKTEGEESKKTYTDFRSIARLFDMNLTNNKDGFFDPYATNYIEGLEGNLTVYDYTRKVGDIGTWRVAAYYGTGNNKPTGIWPTDKPYTIPDEDKDGYADFTKGMGYWVKLDQNFDAKNKADYNNTKIDSRTIPGFLASTSIEPKDYTADMVKEGWNLLAFNDAILRHTTTGLVMRMGITDFNITGPEEVQYVTIKASANNNVEACQAVNKAISAANQRVDTNTTGVYPLNVRCYPVAVEDGVNSHLIMLVSDDRFGIDMAKNTDPAKILSLSGANFKRFDTNISVANGKPKEDPKDGSLVRLWSRYGEYMLAVNYNEEVLKMANAAAPVNGNKDFYKKFNFSITVPAVETGGSKASKKIEPDETKWKQKEHWDINKTINAFALTISGEVSHNRDLFGGKAMGAGWLNEENNSTVYIGMNKRFYVTDDTFVRVYNLTETVQYTAEEDDAKHGDLNGTNWAVRVIGNGKSDVLKPQFKVASGQFTELISTKATNTEIQMQVVDAYDKNRTVAFFSNTISNFDVQEANVSEKKDGKWVPGKEADIEKSNFYSSFDILNDTTVEEVMARESAAEKNGTVLGAISTVYLGSSLASAPITNKGNTVPSSYTDNLKNVPVYVEGFPNDGPLYYLSALGLRPEVIMTAETANKLTGSNAVITWRAVDVTRNPSEWFDDATGFDLFQTEYGKGYWVYLSGGYDVAKAVTIDDNVKYEITGYHHFDNKKKGDYSTTTNHADGSVDSYIGGLYRKSSDDKVYTSGESFNVQASVGGNTHSMNTESGITYGAKAEFTLKLNDYETDGFKESASTIALSVMAADGLGARAKKDGLNIPFVKPMAPEVKVDGSDLEVKSTYAKFLYLFENNISDTTYAAQIKLQLPMELKEEDKTSSVKIDTTAGVFKENFKYPAAVSKDQAPKTLEGAKGLPEPTADLRFVAATDDKKHIGTTTPVFLSDQYHFKYAPIYSGTYVLEVAAENGQDEKPYDTVNKTQLNESRGVKMYASSQGTAMVFPSGVTDVDALHNATTVHTLSVGIKDTSVARIQYSEAYAGKYFFIYVPNKGLYYSIFPNNDKLSGNGELKGIYQLTLVDGSKQIIKKPTGGGGNAGGNGGGGNAGGGNAGGNNG